MPKPSPQPEKQPPNPYKPPLPITIIAHWHNPPLEGEHGAICQYCNEEYTLSHLWPFTNICKECMPDLVHDLATLTDDALTRLDATWAHYLPVLNGGRCPLCHTYDPGRAAQEE